MICLCSVIRLSIQKQDPDPRSKDQIIQRLDPDPDPDHASLIFYDPDPAPATDNVTF